MIDTEELMHVLRDAAKAEIVPRFRRLDASAIRQKSEAIDLVTEADEEAERRIGAEVAARWPQAVFVGEESVAADPTLLDRLDAADLAVVVDPVDGTANFAAGLPLFATMASVVQGGRTIAGIIYDPMGDDWFVAELGGGAWLKRPDGSAERLSVTTAPVLSQMVGTVSMSSRLPKRSEVLANLDKIRVPANYRVAAYDYRLLASGNTHFSVYFNKLMPWDHLAGTLIVQEAGGYAAKLDGTPYLPTQRSGGLILATDPDTWHLLRREVFTL